MKRGAALLLVLAGLAHAQQVRAPTQAEQAALRKFLIPYLHTPFAPDERDTRYTAAQAQLHGTEWDTVVYIQGSHHCTSTGCLLLILAPKGNSYDAISRIVWTELPVWELPESNSGWYDLAVVTKEGPKRLSFSGLRYPRNAYSAPARRLNGSVQGTILIPANPVTISLYDKT